MTRPRLAPSLFIILLVCLAVVTLWRATMRERATEADYPPEGRFVTVEGVKLHYVEAGSGPDLVLIHGASGSLRDLTFGFLPDLARRYHVVAFDRPGMGWSEDAAGMDTLSAQARLIRQASKRIGLRRPIVFGHSYGGAVALAWAVDAPGSLSALALASPVSHPWEGGIDRLYHVTGHPIVGPAAVTAISAFVPTAYVTEQTESVFQPQPAPSGYSEHFGPMMSARASALSANARQRLVLKANVTEQSAEYGTIAVPVEILHGIADSIVSARIHSERLARDVPGARLTLLPGIGHMPHHAARAEVTAAIDRAAARAGRGPAADPLQ
jgi:pimeloyl-ACP methyl ester carboxylesterase